MPSTGGAEPLCRLGYYQNGDHRIDGGRVAVAPDYARFPGCGNVLADPVHLAAQDAWYDVTLSFRVRQAKNRFYAALVRDANRLLLAHRIEHAVRKHSCSPRLSEDRRTAVGRFCLSQTTANLH